MSWSDSRFRTGSRRAGDALVLSLRRHVARRVREFREYALSAAFVVGHDGILEARLAAVQGFWSKVQTLALDCGRRGKGDKGRSSAWQREEGWRRGVVPSPVK